MAISRKLIKFIFSVNSLKSGNSPYFTLKNDNLGFLLILIWTNEQINIFKYWFFSNNKYFSTSTNKYFPTNQFWFGALFRPKRLNGASQHVMSWHAERVLSAIPMTMVHSVKIWTNVCLLNLVQLWITNAKISTVPLKNVRFSVMVLFVTSHR